MIIMIDEPVEYYFGSDDDQTNLDHSRSVCDDSQKIKSCGVRYVKVLILSHS